MSIAVLEIIAENFRKFGDNTSFFTQNKAYSYTELGRAVSAAIHGIKNSTAKRDELLGIFAVDHPATYASILACWFLDKAYLPLNPGDPVARNLHILEKSGINYILDPSETTTNFDFPVEKILLHLPWQAHSETAPEIEAYRNSSADILRYLLFTSGSTGVPKGVPIDRENLDAFLGDFSEAFPDIDETDKFLQIYNLVFDGSFPSWLFPLMRGASVYTVPGGKIRFLEAYRLMKEHELTVLKMAPSTLAFLKPWFESMNLPRVKYCFLGGEALHSALVKDWQKCIPSSRIINVYGPTEATVITSVYDWTEPLNGGREAGGIVSIGKALGNNRLRIFNAEMQEAAPGESGELCISGKQLSKGYLGDEKLSREVFFEMEEKGVKRRYYRTGDRAHRDGEGFIMFEGRKDLQFQKNGYRIEAGEVESCAKEILSGINVAAIPLKGRNEINQLYLFVEDKDADVEKLNDHLAIRLPAYMLPDTIHALAEFPKTAGGKTDREALKKLV